MSRSKCQRNFERRTRPLAIRPSSLSCSTLKLSWRQRLTGNGGNFVEGCISNGTRARNLMADGWMDGWMDTISLLSLSPSLIPSFMIGGHIAPPEAESGTSFFQGITEAGLKSSLVGQSDSQYIQTRIWI